jgi:hypothetical protein
MKNLTFTFTVEQVNTLLQALASQPYQSVVGLINQIERDAKQQLSQEEDKSEELEELEESEEVS